MKGKGFLKVTGILMIIGGGLSCLLSLIAIFGVAVLIAAGANFALVIGLIIGILGGVFELVTGIVGVKNCDKPEAAQKCLVWGVIVLALSILSIILNAIGGGDFNKATLITSCVLPVLFIIGAVLNKQQAEEGTVGAEIPAEEPVVDPTDVQ